MSIRPGFFTLDGVGDLLTTVDSAALSIVGDLDIRKDVEFDDINLADEQTLLAKWGGGTERSWLWNIQNASGIIRFTHSPDGTFGARIEANSTVALDTVISDSERAQLRVTLDVDAGSTDHDVTFYWRTDGDIDSNSGWTQLGAVVNTSGITSIFDGTDPIEMGALPADDELEGKVYGARILDGIGGTVVANPDFRTTVQGDWASLPVTDDHSNSWDDAGDPVYTAPLTIPAAPKKPGPWSVNPADIDPRYQGLWKNLVALYPLWEPGTDRAFDVAGHTTGVAGVLGETQALPSPLGVERQFDTPGTGHGIKVATQEQWAVYFEGQPNATFWVIARYNAGGSGRRAFASASTGAATTNLYLGNDNVDNARFQLRVNATGIDLVSGGGKLSAGDLYHYFGVLRNGSMHLYIASAEDASLPFRLDASNTTQAGETMAFDQAHDVAIGGMDGDTADGQRNWDGAVVIAASWTRALSEADMRMLVQDPFGMIRPSLVAPPTPFPGRFFTKVQKKPGPWSWDLGGIEPRFLNLARNLSYVFPIWSTDAISLDRPITFLQRDVIAAGPEGLALIPNNTGAVNKWTMANSPFDKNEWSIFVRSPTIRDRSAGIQALWTYDRVGVDNGSMGLRSDGTDIFIEYRQASVNHFVIWSGLNWNDANASVGVVKKGTVWELFLDGRSQGKRDQSATISAGFDDPFALGNYTHISDSNADGAITAAYIWNRALSSGDMLLLEEDPYGLIRQDVFVSEAVAGAIDLTTLSSTTFPSITLEAIQLGFQTKFYDLTVVDTPPPTADPIDLTLLSSTVFHAPTVASASFQMATLSSTVFYSIQLDGTIDLTALSSVVFYSPQLDAFIDLTTLASTVLYSPQLDGEVLLTLLSSTVFPSIALVGVIDLTHLASTVFHSPQLDGNIDLTLLNSTIFYSSLVADSSLPMDLLSSTVFYSPQLDGEILLTNLSNTTFFSIFLDGIIDLTTLSSTVFYSPQLDGEILLTSLASTVFYSISVSSGFTMDLLTSTVFYSPQLDGEILLTNLSSTVFYLITLADIAPDPLDMDSLSTTVFHSIFLDGIIDLTNLSSTTFFSPQLDGTIDLTTLSSTVFPSITVGAATVDLTTLDTTTFYSTQIDGSIVMDLLDSSILYTTTLSGSSIDLILLSSTVFYPITLADPAAPDLGIQLPMRGVDR